MNETREGSPRSSRERRERRERGAARGLGAMLCCAMLATLALAACAPEVGSERWCEAMREKPRGDWSVNEGVEFARHCLFEAEE